MTASSAPKRSPSDFFHRRHSDRRVSRSTSPQEHNKPNVFEGTDTVIQNRRSALQRIIEVHDALQHQTEETVAERPITPLSMFSDSFSTHFSIATPFPDAEARAFRYFLRMWDPSVTPDADFDHAISPSRLQFEEAAIKHFFRRIALWHESEDVQKAAKEKMSWHARKREKEGEKSALGKMWTVEKGRQEHHSRDELKEVTSREGLAQLLWTLMHDPKVPLAPELLRECTEAVKRMYGIRS